MLAAGAREDYVRILHESESCDTSLPTPQQPLERDPKRRDSNPSAPERESVT